MVVGTYLLHRLSKAVQAQAGGVKGAGAAAVGTATAIALAATIAKITDRACAANVSHVTIELCTVAIGSFEFRTWNVIIDHDSNSTPAENLLDFFYTYTEQYFLDLLRII